ncbi:hypothetical protein PR202_ga27766 [Eleusine coracana subsp. coracana]|uniref:Uncharacterized protein n=1 Tax=Eleusine coracana subsp. coracana TaxID=191504 RepID=A0AAV5DHS0_ELECO|nr:hypothetical protein PR202_ga27766 [Eleusine coracana subsp. coracana]
MTTEEVGESLDNRVTDPDWKYLFSYWMSPEFEDQLKDVLQVYPEMKERTIQEVDVFSVVCGVKEPKGYVRGPNCIARAKGTDRTSAEPMSQHGSTSLQQVQHLSNPENDDNELDGDEEDSDSDEGSDDGSDQVYTND